MPILTFLISSIGRVYSTETDESIYSLKLHGKFEKNCHLTINYGEKKWVVGNAPIYITVLERPHRSECPKISIYDPYDPKEEHRDILRVDDYLSDEPFFWATISVTAELYKTIGSINDAGNTELSVTFNTGIGLVPEQGGNRIAALHYGDYDIGSEVIWDVDEKQPYVWLEEVTIHITSILRDYSRAIDESSTDFDNQNKKERQSESVLANNNPEVQVKRSFWMRLFSSDTGKSKELARRKALGYDK